MDPATIAVGITAIIGPFLPFLVKSGEEAAKEAGKRFGAATWERVSGIWSKLLPKVESTPSAMSAVERATARPDDSRATGALELELEEILKQDPRLLHELGKALQEAQVGGFTVSASGNRSIAIGGNVTGSRFSTGDQGRAPTPSRDQ